jgi:hypothetical protein
LKTVALVLLFANVAFFAWSAWIDTPHPVAPAATEKELPPLVLASEADGQKAASVASGTAAPATASPTTCVSVGPFDSQELADGAAKQLRERGYDPRQRSEEGERWDGYWVYVGNLKSELEEARVMRTLIQAQVSDARIMPVSPEGRRVSVGVFSERIRAERRAHALERLNLVPTIGERRTPGTVYWEEVDLKPGDPPVVTDGLLAPDTPASTLGTRACSATPG